ncbi:MAG: polysaccharide deacetylase family protein [Patescibacteria group bacterium]|nr:polysaccharide deacetylase family protein [Patescibacteria group bacterium]
MIAIFNYHSVDDSDYFYSVSKSVFYKQLSWIKSSFKIIRLEQLKDYLSHPDFNKNKIAIVTFDDGLADNYFNVLPVIKELKVPITVFIPPNLIGKKIFIPDRELEIMDLEKIKEMQASGLVNFASHGLDHKKMTSLGEVDLEKNLKLSKELIQGIFGEKGDFFAYPKADSNEEVRKMTARYYQFAFGGNGVILDNKNIDKYNLPRIIINKNISNFKFRLMLKKIPWKIKGYLK